MIKTTTKSKKTKSLEETLYNDIAKTLRGAVEAAEYKHVTLPLLFLKFINVEKQVEKVRPFTVAIKAVREVGTQVI